MGSKKGRKAFLTNPWNLVSGAIPWICESPHMESELWNSDIPAGLHYQGNATRLGGTDFLDCRVNLTSLEKLYAACVYTELSLLKGLKYSFPTLTESCEGESIQFLWETHRALEFHNVRPVSAWWFHPDFDLPLPTPVNDSSEEQLWQVQLEDSKGTFSMHQCGSPKVRCG